MPSNDPRAVVEQYYRLVDANALDEMFDLFADDAVYERPGYEPLKGKNAIEAFYRGTRVISSGRHLLDRVIVEDGAVAVEGSFAGELRDGSSASVRFADFFVLNNGKFAHRNTYFFAAAV